MARVVTIDWSKVTPIKLHSSGKVRDRGNAQDSRPVTEDGKLLTKKQIRARARRAAKRNTKKSLSDIEFDTLYKPIEEWDIEELARGRPRNIDGNFNGRKPTWITRQVHEKSMELFVDITRSDMSALAPSALKSLKWVLESDEVDYKSGKPIVPAAAKNQAAMFLLEHVVGKPKQRVEQDISVKLQGILGAVMVNPNDALASPEQGGQGYQLAHLPGQTIPLGIEGPSSSDEDDDDDLDIMDG